MDEALQEVGDALPDTCARLTFDELRRLIVATLITWSQGAGGGPGAGCA